jgi:hypothetical protein
MCQKQTTSDISTGKEKKKNCISRNENNDVGLTVSAQISQDHIATAFHFLISNRGAALPTGLHTAASFACYNKEGY